MIKLNSEPDINYAIVCENRGNQNIQLAGAESYILRSTYGVDMPTFTPHLDSKVITG
jgi:hypothetical protein